MAVSINFNFHCKPCVKVDGDGRKGFSFRYSVIIMLTERQRKLKLYIYPLTIKVHAKGIYKASKHRYEDEFPPDL